MICIFFMKRDETWFHQAVVQINKTSRPRGNREGLPTLVFFSSLYCRASFESRRENFFLMRFPKTVLVCLTKLKKRLHFFLYLCIDISRDAMRCQCTLLEYDNYCSHYYITFFYRIFCFVF